MPSLKTSCPESLAWLRASGRVCQRKALTALWAVFVVSAHKLAVACDLQHSYVGDVGRLRDGAKGVSGLDGFADAGSPRQFGLGAPSGGASHVGERVGHLAALGAPRFGGEVVGAVFGLLALPGHVVGPFLRVARVVGHGLGGACDELT